MIRIILIGIFLLVVIGLLIAFFIFRKNKRAELEAKEAKTAAFIDKMSVKRAAINTKYIEEDFFNCIQSLVYSFYAQDPQYIPNTNILQDFYQKRYNEMKREYDLGITRQVFNYKMEKARVVKQDNSSMYAVTHIIVEAQFSVDYLYFHPTMKKRCQRVFKQRFVFLNTNNCWIIQDAQPEEVIEENEIT